jgi:DHA2 family multidrug resistance protein
MSAVAEAGAPAEFAEAAGAPNRTAITIILTVATLMQTLDTTIVNVALPHMEGSLGATQDQISWVLTSYIVAAAIMTPATGWLAGRFGRTRLFVLSMAGFTLCSGLCGLAASLPQMVLFRLLQGVFGAALMPLSQAIMLDTHPPRDIGRAMSIWGMGVMIGPILGPTLGGYLTDEFSWRWCFYINLPVGILGVLGALAFLRESERAADRKFDWSGFSYLTLAIGAFQLALDRGEQMGWLQSNEIKIEFVLAAFGLYMFIVHSITTRRPFIDLALFKDRNFVVCILLATTTGLGFNGSMIMTPLLLQNELNYPVVTAGLLMGPRGLGVMFAMGLYGRIANRVDARLVILLGLCLVGLSMYQMSGWSLMIGKGPVMWVGVVQGLGLGFTFAPLMTLAFTTVPAALRTEASSFFSLTRNVGGAIGISIVSARLAELTQSNHAHLATYITPFRHMAGGVAARGATALELLNFNISRQASMVAFVNVYYFLAIVSVIFAPLLLLLRSSRSQANAAAAGASDAPH